MKRKAHVTHFKALPEGEVFFTKPEVGRLLKVCDRTVTSMMRRGELPYLKIGGRLVRFRLADIERRLTETVLVCNEAAGEEDAYELASQAHLQMGAPDLNTASRFEVPRKGGPR